jgi:site-specific DNA recombinase
MLKQQGCRPTHFARLIRLNYLAPDIATSILAGTQPAELDRKILLDSNVPTSWAVQRKLFGFPAPERVISQRNLFGRGMWPAAGQMHGKGAATHTRDGAAISRRHRSRSSAGQRR